ncbi:tetratricopeptide repeat protein, partial [Myxococcota bacterium]|nr:tetratricopeptide repeat protein [Myxococcota bacterium]
MPNPSAHGAEHDEGLEPSTTSSLGALGPAPTDAADAEAFLGHLHRGAELLRDRRPDEARAELERAFQLSPKSPKAQNLLGLAYFKLGLLEAAKSIYDRLVEDLPNEPSLAVNLGLVLLRQGRLAEAERTLRRALALAPEHTRAHCYLGLVLYRRGDLALARDHFLRGDAHDFARRVEARLAQTAAARTPQGELLRQVADTGFRELSASEMPFRELDLAKDERVVRDEDAWEAMVTHGDDRRSPRSLGADPGSLLPVWALTPLPAPAEGSETEPPEARTILEPAPAEPSAMPARDDATEAPRAALDDPWRADPPRRASWLEETPVP